MAAATFMTDIIEIITQAAEAAAMIGSLWSSAKMVEQSKDYYKLYAAQRTFYYNVFQRGAEAPLAAEVYNTPFVDLDYAGAEGELYSDTGVFGGAMGDTLDWWGRHAAMFGTAPSAVIEQDEYDTDRALLETQWVNVMFRFEEANVDMLSDQRWDHRMKLHNVALKQQSAVVGGLAAGNGLREQTMSNTSGYLADMANSLAERRGLIQAHRDVRERFAELADGTGTYASNSAGFRPAETFGARDSQRYSAETFALGTKPATPDHFRDVR